MADDFFAFFTTGPVAGFGVSDFDATRTGMLAADVDVIGHPQHRVGASWQHLRCPDGSTAEIVGSGSSQPAAPGQ